MAKRSIFYKIYFIFIAVFCVALSVALIWLNGWLKSYEAAQPVNLINGIIETQLKNGDIDRLINDCGLKISKYETKENIDLFLDENISEKTLSAVVSSKLPEGAHAAYSIAADNKKILTIYLKKDSDSAAFLPKYSVLYSELEKNFYKTVSITMPQDATVSLNGKVIDDADATEIDLPQFVENFLKNEKTVKQKSVVIENLLSENVTVTAEYSGETVDVHKKDNTYSVYQYIDDAVKKNVRDIATEGSKAYAGYMQGDASLAQVAAYFDTSSDFYKNIRSSYTDHILEHTAEGFVNVVNDEVFKYSDNIYSCRVEFTQVLKRNGMTYKIYFKKYVFLEKNGNTFSIIDIKSPEES